MSFRRRAVRGAHRFTSTSLWALLPLTTVAALLAASCSSTDESVGERTGHVVQRESTSSDVPDAACPLLELRATRQYAPDHWQDAIVRFDTPKAFRVPAELPVQYGASGTFNATLVFGETRDGPFVTCTYRGDADDASARPEGAPPPGSRYTFVSCSDGATPGAVRSARELVLHLESGDPTHPEQRTRVRLFLEEACADAGMDAGADATLDAPSEASEEDAAVDAFSEASEDVTVDVEREAAEAGDEASTPACTLALCDDGNACTRDSCSAEGTCQHEAVADGTSCANGNACDGEEVCRGGLCAAGLALTLDDGNPCTTDACDATRGVTHTPVAAGTRCGDNADLCAGVSACTADGQCVRGLAPGVPASTACARFACDPATGSVVSTFAAAGSACSDGNACNGDERCDDAGTCQPGTAPRLDDQNICTTDTCDAALGVLHTPVAEGTSCANGNTCDGDEVCRAGTCTAGTSPALDDGNPCTVDACDATRGVTHTPVAAGTRCGDNANLCLGTSACTADGQCVHGPAPTLLAPTACLAYACDPATGTVTAVPAAAGTACGDGNACNGDERCDNAGTCLHVTAPTVDDGNPCTTDACDPATGVTHTPVAAGTSCSDGNACNGDERCNAGACEPGAPLALDDGNVCTRDACDPRSGVTHTPMAGCDATPTRGEDPFETRASLLANVRTTSGTALVDFSVEVFDANADGGPMPTPRADAMVTRAGDGSFRVRLSNFPEAEPERSPPHKLIVRVQPRDGFVVTREAYAHPGDVVDLGTLVVAARDPAVTVIGPEGGRAVDSQGLIEVVVPPGAVTAPVPVRVTPFRTREELPAELPANTVTTYGFELEPDGTTFAQPVTVRLRNWRQVPTSLDLPVGYFNKTHQRWEHVGYAHWDGERFAFPTTHFSTYDANPAEAGQMMVRVTTQGSPSGQKCGVGSSVGYADGALHQSFALPSYRHAGVDYGVTLHYASRLAGTYTPGTETPPPAVGAVPQTSYVVHAGRTVVETFCQARGKADPSSGGGGSGFCATGAGCALTVQYNDAHRWEAQRSALGSRSTSSEAAQDGDRGVEFGSWVTMPLTGAGETPAAGFVPSHLQAMLRAAGSCVAVSVDEETPFGASSADAARISVNLERGPLAELDQHVFVHHRHNSPFGAGWSVEEVNRLYVAPREGRAILVDGGGDQEEFRPAATITRLPSTTGGMAPRALARDVETGEAFVALPTGEILRIQGERTTVVHTGLSLDGMPYSLAVTRVDGERRFLVALPTRLIEVDGSGATRVLRSRPVVNNARLLSQPVVAAFGGVAVYSEALPGEARLFRIDLRDPNRTTELLSAERKGGGEVALDPVHAIGFTQLGAPQGLAFDRDGTLYVADRTRNAVYQVWPNAQGQIARDSRITRAVGDGAGRFVPPEGTRIAAHRFPINQPTLLSVDGEGYVWMFTAYGAAVYDPVAQEAWWSFVDGNTPSSDLNLGVLVQPTSEYGSAIALDATTLLVHVGTEIVRLGMRPFVSPNDPTRVLERTPSGWLLTDRTRGLVEAYDAAGRMTERARRTGEALLRVEYTDVRSDRVARILDRDGGATEFVYAEGKLSVIRDPMGREIQVDVDAQGDLAGFTEPDGEAHRFTYEAHHMQVKTSPQGDVTRYTYAPDGTVRTTQKPGGETYTFSPSYGNKLEHGSDGKPVRKGSFIDPRGVEHVFEIDPNGQMARETYTADGKAYEVRQVPADIAWWEPTYLRPRRLVRTAYTMVNGVPTELVRHYDLLGRLVELRAGNERRASFTYDSEGWLSSLWQAPAINVVRTFGRDASGHVRSVSEPGHTVSFTYRPDGQLATRTERGVTWTFGYDENDKNVTSLTPQAGAQLPTLTVGYDLFGNVTRSSDGDGAVTAHFDANNRLEWARDPSGHETTYRYARPDCGCSEESRVTSVHTPDLPEDRAWRFEYGPGGRLARTLDPDGHAHALQYDARNQLTGTEDPLGHTAALRYDALGRLRETQDPLGRTLRAVYPDLARGVVVGPSMTVLSPPNVPPVTSLSAPLAEGQVQIGQSALSSAWGDPPRISFYRDATFELGYGTTYNAAGWPLSVKDRAGIALTDDGWDRNGRFFDATMTYKPDALVPVVTNVSSSTPAPWWTEFAYNEAFDMTQSNLVRVAPNTERYGRDALGRVRHIERYFGVARDDSYRQTGFVWQVTDVTRDARGRVTETNSYTEDGREELSENPVTHEETRVYRRDRMPYDKRTLTYDAHGRVATLTVEREGTYTFHYDEMGRVDVLTYPDGHRRTQRFDFEGRIVERCYVYDAGTTRCYGADYDAAGSPSRLSDPEGEDRIGIDALGRLTRVERWEQGTLRNVETYAYNALGALTQNADTPLAHQRPRVGGGALADAAVPREFAGHPVTLDAGGRITSLAGQPVSFDARGQLTGAAGASFVYNAHGERVQMNTRRGGEARQLKLAYEAGHVASVIGSDRIPARNDSGYELFEEVPLEKFLYDGVDHPLSYSRLGYVADVSRDARGGVHVGCCTVDRVDVAYYELDLAGNVRRLRAPGGADLGGYRYTAFGKAYPADAGTPAAQVEQPLRWKGRWWNELSGTYDMRAREWSPELGVFLSIDGLGYFDTKSTLWGWPEQNPIRYSDPSGNCPGCIGALIGGIGGGVGYALTAPTNLSFGAFMGGALQAMGVGATAGAALAMAPGASTAIGLALLATQVPNHEKGSHAAMVNGALLIAAGQVGGAACPAKGAGAAASGAEGAAEYEAASGSVGAMRDPSPPQIPSHAQSTLAQIRQTGQPPAGYVGGRVFRNAGRNGERILPQSLSDGTSITYREYDVKPFAQGVNRGAERIVVGSDGRAWYTDDHYGSYIQM